MSGRPAFLEPEVGPHTLKETRWGGQRLGRLRGGDSLAGRSIGESWEFSTLAGSESRVAGVGLESLLGAPLPFLAKLIDTDSSLSVQVHPDDDRATSTPGKEEAWVVLEASPGARVWAGLGAGVDRDAFAARLDAALADSAAGDAVVGSLREIPVANGTCILVPAGTIHAIGPGILLAEIQQPSDCTYRFFDYGSGRDLQVAEALAALQGKSQPALWQPGDPAPGDLRGKHVRVRVLAGPTRESAAPVDPELVIPIRGEVIALDAIGRSTLSPGALRLWVDEGTLELGKDALVAIGQVR